MLLVALNFGEPPRHRASALETAKPVAIQYVSCVSCLSCFFCLSAVSELADRTLINFVPPRLAILSRKKDNLQMHLVPRSLRKGLL